MLTKILMHKNEKVLSYLEDKNGKITEVKDIYNEQLLPFMCNNYDLYKFKLQQWFLDNKVSLNRKDINEIVSFYGQSFLASPNFVSLLNFYWVKRFNDKITWEDIDPRVHWNCNNDIINLLSFYPHMIEDEIEDVDFNSPNYTLNTYEPAFFDKQYDGTFYILYPDYINKDIDGYVIKYNRLFGYKKLEYLSEDIELIPIYYYIDTLLPNKEEIVKNINNFILSNHLNVPKSKRIHEWYVARDPETFEIKGIEVI